MLSLEDTLTDSVQQCGIKAALNSVSNTAWLWAKAAELYLDFGMLLTATSAALLGLHSLQLTAAMWQQLLGNTFMRMSRLGLLSTVG